MTFNAHNEMTSSMSVEMGDPSFNNKQQTETNELRKDAELCKAAPLIA